MKDNLANVRAYISFRRGYADAGIALDDGNATGALLTLQNLDHNASCDVSRAYADGYAHGVNDWIARETNAVNRPCPASLAY